MVTNMNEEKIIEGNKIIAKHEGWLLGKYEHLPNRYHKMIDGEEYGYNLYQFSYHSDWNELMPVVLKLEKAFCKDFELIIYSSSCHIKSLDDKNPSFMGTGPCIEAIFECITDFIKWQQNERK
jgi:hypothetical protein